MNKRSLLFTSFLSLMCFFVLPATAQEASKNSPPENLVLEVTYFKGRPVASQPLVANGKSGSAWYALFQRNPEFKVRAGALPVRAVNIVPRMEGETARIRVSVFTGHKFHDKEEFVADYTIRENEKAVVTELAEFGVEPFELAVVRAAPTIADLPVVVNNSESLEVLVEPNFSTLPTFKAKLKNNSNKAVSAVTIETRLGSRQMTLRMLYDPQTRLLIPSAATYETVIGHTQPALKNALTQELGQLPNLSLVVIAVVFEDGSYEGNSYEAARFRAFSLGRKIFLERTIRFLQTLSVKESEFIKLTEKISLLSEELDETACQNLLNEFPMLTENEKSILKGVVQNIIKAVKREIVGDTRTYLEIPNRNLEELKGKYQNWLARISK